MSHSIAVGWLLFSCIACKFI